MENSDISITHKVKLQDKSKTVVQILPLSVNYTVSLNIYFTLYDNN